MGHLIHNVTGNKDTQVLIPYSALFTSAGQRSNDPAGKLPLARADLPDMGQQLPRPPLESFHVACKPDDRVA